MSQSYIGKRAISKGIGAAIRKLVVFAFRVLKLRCRKAGSVSGPCKSMGGQDRRDVPIEAGTNW